MVSLHDYYYLGDAAGLREQAILDSLNRESAYPGVWFITLSVNKIEQLDILSAEAYFSGRNRDRRMEIVGIAYGKHEAFEVVRRIADDVYRKQSAKSIRDYFMPGT